MAETLTVRVIEREIQGAEVVVLTLASPDGAPLPSFSAGAHIDLHLGDGIVRQYSLCGSAHHPQHYRLGILKDRAAVRWRRTLYSPATRCKLALRATCSRWRCRRLIAF